jgi:hypothetical protein
MKKRIACCFLSSRGERADFRPVALLDQNQSRRKSPTPVWGGASVDGAYLLEDVLGGALPGTRFLAVLNRRALARAIYAACHMGIACAPEAPCRGMKACDCPLYRVNSKLVVLHATYARIGKRG